MLPPLARLALRRVITCANDKGGVGKTSIVANVAGLLALAGFRVLVIDLDDQGNMGEDLGYTYTGEGDNGLGAFVAVSTGQPLTPMKNVRPGLDVVPAGKPHTTELAMLLQMRRATARSTEDISRVVNALATSLAPIAESYDVVLIDCPPKIEVLQEVALGASRWLLIPTHSDASSRKAVREIANRFTTAREYNETLDLLGVVLFGSTIGGTRLREQTFNEIAQDLGSRDRLFEAFIRFVEASAKQTRDTGTLVHELELAATEQEPWWKALRAKASGEPGTETSRVASSVTGLASDYQRLTQQIVDRLQEAEALEAATAAGEEAQ